MANRSSVLPILPSVSEYPAIAIPFNKKLDKWGPPSYPAYLAYTLRLDAAIIHPNGPVFQEGPKKPVAAEIPRPRRSLFPCVSFIKGISAFRTEFRGLRRIVRLPSALIAPIEQSALRLFRAALRAEFSLVQRAAGGALPARSLNGRAAPHSEQNLLCWPVAPQAEQLQVPGAAAAAGP